MPVDTVPPEWKLEETRPQEDEMILRYLRTFAADIQNRGGQGEDKVAEIIDKTACILTAYAYGLQEPLRTANKLLQMDVALLLISGSLLC